MASWAGLLAAAVLATVAPGCGGTTGESDDADAVRGAVERYLAGRGASEQKAFCSSFLVVNEEDPDRAAIQEAIPFTEGLCAELYGEGKPRQPPEEVAVKSIDFEGDGAAVVEARLTRNGRSLERSLDVIKVGEKDWRVLVVDEH